MNNIKKMILGFAAVAMIVSFSAFKGGNTQSDKATIYLVQISPGVWEERTTQPNSTECANPQPRQCYYEVNDNDILHGGSYNSTEIDEFLGDDQIQSGDNSEGALYTGP